MQPRREGMIWEVLGLLVVIAAALEIRSAAQHFTWALNQKAVGIMEVVWPFALGVFSGFLLLAGATAVILGRQLGVVNGGKHRSWMWRIAGAICCLTGFVAIMLKMTNIAMSRAVRYGESSDFYSMLNNGDFAIAISGGFVFLLGVMLIMADRLSTRLHSANTAKLQP
jgi:hypothetical protein